MDFVDFIEKLKEMRREAITYRETTRKFKKASELLKNDKNTESENIAYYEETEELVDDAYLILKDGKREAVRNCWFGILKTCCSFAVVLLLINLFQINDGILILFGWFFVIPFIFTILAFLYYILGWYRLRNAIVHFKRSYSEWKMLRETKNK